MLAAVGSSGQGVKSMQLEWKRAVRDETDISRRRLWHSRNGQYVVIEAVPKLTGLRTVFYAVNSITLRILGKHKQRATAIRTCEQDFAARCSPKLRKS